LINEKSEEDIDSGKHKMEALEQKVDEIEDALDEFAKQVPIYSNFVSFLYVIFEYSIS